MRGGPTCADFNAIFLYFVTVAKTIHTVIKDIFLICEIHKIRELKFLILWAFGPS